MRSTNHSYARIAVDFADEDRLKTYTYAVPEGVSVSPGDLVWAPFGHRSIQGLAIAISRDVDVDAATVREIESVVDGGPFVLEPLLRVGCWIAEYYRCNIFTACLLMLPPGANRRLHIWISRTGLATRIDSTLAGLSISPEMLKALQEVPSRGRIRRDRLVRQLGRANEKHLDRLLRDGFLKPESLWDTPRVKPSFRSYVRLGANVIDAEAVALRYEARRAFKRAAVVRLLATAKSSVPRTELTSKFSAGVIKSVLEDGNAELEQVRVDRDPLADYAAQDSILHSLLPEQISAVDAVTAAFAKLRVTGVASSGSAGKFLLFGVTGSGKTEVYLRAAEECVKSGRRAIIMVPEIAMTPQILQRFAARFPGQIALQHSGLSVGQRYDQWHRIKSGEYRVVIGSRAGIFAPVHDLGLVVIDEEHEWTFKQSDRAPRYHAREVAERLCEETGAVLILGSATPDVATYRRTQEPGTGSDRLHFLSLPRRINAALREETGNDSLGLDGHPISAVEIINMRDELAAGHREMFSRPLLKALRENVENGGKSILFINRRGTASFIQCATCGVLRSCSTCHTPLTLHRMMSGAGRLRCHYCGYSIGADRKCRACGGIGLGRRAAGTQGVEEALRGYFPRTRILRWDADTARNVKQHEKLLQEFQSEGNHILIGTQMIAKGLDIPTVSLVGVVAADIGLAAPSFRSTERTFQILSQVTGRAGRGDTPGRSIIQTFQPSHRAIVAAAKQDYAGFYAAEIETRRKYQLPPFRRYVRLIYASFQETDAELEAASLRTRINDQLSADARLDVEMLGPSPTFPMRFAGRYRWQIMLSGAAPEKVLDAVTLGSGWIIDVDPIETN